MTRTDYIQPLTAEAAAAEWLALKRSGRMTADEARALDAWLDADPAHRPAFEAMHETWRALGEVGDDPAVMEVREWALRAYNRPARMRIAAALGACFVLAGGWATWWASTPAPLPAEVMAAAADDPQQEFRTGVGQTTTATLFDGSVVTLDTNTALAAREVGGIRLVELKKGQAFFKVAKDRTRPFKVVAGGRTVTATGTSFSVRVEPDRFQVTLVEGAVVVEAPRSTLVPGKARELKPGFSLKAEDERRWKVSRVDVAAETSWRGGQLTFHDRPLGEAAAEMNRYSRRKVVVDPAIAGTPILGVFPSGDVEAFARAAEATQIARVSQADETRIVLALPDKNLAGPDMHNIGEAPSS